MAHLYVSLEPTSYYWDKKSARSRDEWLQKIRVSMVVYVGNLSFYTTEDQVTEVFSKVGSVKQVVMGLNSQEKRPCGFCFVEFFERDSADRSVKLLNGSLVDGRVIRVDWDTGQGISSSRKYGRGIRGFQWRDEFRTDFDPGRGGDGGGIDVNALSKKRRRSTNGENHGAESQFSPMSPFVPGGFPGGPPCYGMPGMFMGGMPFAEGGNMFDPPMHFRGGWRGRGRGRRGGNSSNN